MCEGVCGGDTWRNKGERVGFPLATIHLVVDNRELEV